VAVADVVRFIGTNPVYRSRVACHNIADPEPAAYGTLDQPLPEALAAYLAHDGIRLYTHQCEAVNLLREQKNVIITTPTASGKTLAFNLPVFECMAADPDARALYLYPTKALANDQLATLLAMEKFTGISVKPAIYDGDTPQSKRSAIREQARIVISNPYELHQILSWHGKWSPFFSNLQHIVLDEAHRYRGIFGSQIALLVRRLRRVARFYGTCPQFVLSSATLANPEEFAGKLTGLSFVQVNSDGSPRGKRHFVLYNPFFDGVGERSAHQESKDILVSCVKGDLQALCFASSRKIAELVALWAKEDLRRSSARLAESVLAYRAGYLPEERRRIESRLKGREIKGVVSTNALELGIDIGSLDAVIIDGYPGTMMSTWQQAGRAGRKAGESLAVLVAQANPLDQYFMHHPDEFFSRPHEHAIIDTGNPYIVSGHLLCAAAELPLREEKDREFFGDRFSPVLLELAGGGLLSRTPRGFVYAGRGRAAEAVTLDGMAAESFRILCEGQVLETMDRAQAYREAHKGAIMLHQGITYVVNEMNLETHTVRVSEIDVDYYTQPLKDTSLKILETLETCDINGVTCAFGDVEVTERYTAYKIKKGDTVLGVEPLDLPPITFRTKAFWLVVPDALAIPVGAAGLDLAGGLHGAEHALIALMPLFVLCDRWDIGGLSCPAFDENGEPMIFVYDGYEGGIGLAEKAYTLLPELFSRTHVMVRDCTCKKGCPSCIYSPKCGNDNVPLDKEATVMILAGFAAAGAGKTAATGQAGCIPGTGPVAP
jgi:DEAD/DEAH box helicase domain-containing protein